MVGRLSISICAIGDFETVAVSAMCGAVSAAAARQQVREGGTGGRDGADQYPEAWPRRRSSFEARRHRHTARRIAHPIALCYYYFANLFANN
ncbi:hypothetical protein EVAR_8041_1 [Eumeta japonica]|uniref:Uncharacterized protein n=1 Tax=Eumeta variegata TaxID=151549 RepID=A0A4C1TKC7_EUMVA|nr:hypothetical protein EVAR_8041_1 [Eumeta japonica]